MSRNFSPKTWLDWIKSLPGKTSAGYERGSAQGGQEAAAFMRQKTLEAGAIGSAEMPYYKGWYGEYDGKDTVVGNNAPHSMYVEVGRKPGRMPPVDVIQRWVEFKFHVGGDKARQIAWAVARQIALNGMRGRYLLRKNEWKLRLVILRAVAREIGKEWIR